MTQSFLSRFVVAAIAAIGLVATSTPEASAAWVHRGTASAAPHPVSSSRTWTGPEGRTYSRSGSTNCANGTCNRTETYTGPNGRSVTTNDSVTRTGRGPFSSSETTTGP